MKSRVGLGRQHLPRTRKLAAGKNFWPSAVRRQIAAASYELHRGCDDFGCDVASALLVDPLGFDAGDSNLYRYVNNAPTDGTDPSGLQEARTTITVSIVGKGVGKAKDDLLGFHNQGPDDLHFGFKVTVTGPNAASIKKTVVKQEAFALVALRYGTKWAYILVDKNNAPPGKALDEGEEGWKAPYAAWKKDGAIDSLTLDKRGKQQIDGTPEKVMEVFPGSELSDNKFSWSDFPGLAGKTFKDPNLDQVIFYRTFKITATPPKGEPVTAVFSVIQNATKKGQLWNATPKLSETNRTYPDLEKPKTWP